VVRSGVKWLKIERDLKSIKIGAENDVYW